MKASEFKYKIGDKLTIANDLITAGGGIVFEAGDKVTISGIEKTEGHYSKQSGCEDIYYEETVDMIKLAEVPNIVYGLSAFKEFNLTNNGKEN